jgi:hypothetical protein
MKKPVKKKKQSGPKAKPGAKKGTTKATGRDYKKERKYDGKESTKKNRNASNRARYKLEKEGKVKKGDGKHVIHKNNKKGTPKNDKRSNLGVQSASKNSSFPRNKSAGRKRG